MTDLSIIPFGGVRENGKNMYAVTVNDEIFILDAGLKYPETDQLGVDVVVPDFEYLIKNAEKIANKLEVVNIKYLILKPDIIIIVKALNKYIAASDNEGEIINSNEGAITNKIPIKQCFLLLQL